MTVTSSEQITWIEDADALARLADTARAAPWVALDTESNSYFVYRERVCLIQINLGGDLAVIDPIALGDGADALDPLRESLCDPDQPLLLHGGEYDVAVMKRDYDIALRGIWDTQQAASLVGMQRTGYGALVAAFTGVELGKGYSRYNWAERPLDEEALRYALDDVRYLPTVVEATRQIVAEAGIEEEMAIACAAVEDAAPHAGEFDASRMWRIKGTRGLDDAQLVRLSILYAWRDEVAAAENLPPGRMLNNDALLALSRREMSDLSSLKRSRLRGGVVRQYGDDLLERLTAAASAPPPLPPRPKSGRVDPTIKIREQHLKRWRNAEAERRGLPSPTILPPRALEHLAKHGAEDLDAVPQFGAKRADLYGEALAKLLAG